MTEEILPDSEGCVSKVVDSWRSLLSTLSVGHRIYPSDPSTPKDCEFIFINSSVRLGVIHIKPGNARKSILLQPTSNDQNTNSKRSSLSEEYWFTEMEQTFENWNLQLSLRYSIISNQPTVQNVDKKRESILSADLPPTKIRNIQTFVERIIQETFFEAFHEYYMLQNQNETGNINLAYETTEEDDVVVTLRKKCKTNVKNNGNLKSTRSCSDISLNKANRSSTTGSKMCVHKKVQKKPLIMLFHGIGTSADIWSIITTSLACRGFETVAPDILGHGFSSAPDKSNYYTFSNLLLQALTVFDHYMTDEKQKCILIGHCYGGGGPTPLAPPVKENEITPFGCVYTLLHPLLYCGLKRSFFYASRGKQFKACNEESAVPTYVLQHIANGQKWAEGDAAFHRRILVPTLLIHGLQDRNVTLVQECEMERTIPRAFLELIPNAGHMTMIETPEHLIHMIMCFLDMWICIRVRFFEKICDQSIICHLEDRCFWILINGDNCLTVFHASEMLNCTRNANSDIQILKQG
ncbi:hypothetical protein NQ318_013546 [Aromia moschata]|uniref:acylglycerol lipase n=1 Tax=Aromia moschata TaxID=1265417 RepID=A0AAV8XXR5_9CUCU|nr:hypothetical protein NQ318_013546 [Aromia moschata]